MTSDLGSRANTRTVPQILALTFGVVYTLVAVIGFFVAGSNFVQPTGPEIVIFQVNHLHNIAHLLFGLAGIAMSRTLPAARSYGWALGVVFAILTVFGFALSATGNLDEQVNFLALNTADNILHILTAAVGFVIALMPVDRTASR